MIDDINKLLADHQATGTPLPMLEEHDVNRRLTAGWDANDPLLPVSTGTLARQAGYVQLWTKWMLALRKPLTDTLNAVGIEKIFGRNAAEAPTTDDAILLPWTLPLHRSEHGLQRWRVVWPDEWLPRAAVASTVPILGTHALLTNLTPGARNDARAFTHRGDNE